MDYSFFRWIIKKIDIGLGIRCFALATPRRYRLTIYRATCLPHGVRCAQTNYFHTLLIDLSI